MIEFKNVLKDKVAEELRRLYFVMPFDDMSQDNPKPYGTDVLDLPDSTEHYSCGYQRSKALEKTDIFKDVVTKALKAVVDTMYCNGEFSCMAYRMLPGHYFRTHDDLSNGTGFIYYLSKDWKWDWGGILTIIEDKPVSVLPRFNRMVIIEKKGTPHFVSRVMEYAKEPRMSIVGFINGTARPLSKAN